ncbi:family A G protein-coupled receptor-like protein [Cystobasidium minutum MCA 4210]|uniref:family A G protein-coupled receptor-like protein n=1 Tax=Cystobasidium minutum MCA 4210 TaxID=1397322 RepID=UPI0034CFD8CE|eukprot:jgi/Rhomi1/147364/e_gw1.8.351.1
MANNVLEVNPPYADAHITTRGSDFLWAIFAVMLATAIGVTAWGMTRPVGTRAFHWFGAAILFTASTAYFSMASDLGAVPVAVEFVRYRGNLFTDTAINPYTRQIWYARYIDWTITTPLLLLELLLASGMPLGDIVFTIFMDLLMIITGLIGALVVSDYKWGYFAGGCIAMLVVFYQLIVPGRASAKAISQAAYDSFFRSALVLSVLWFLYPIAWGLADGGNYITPDSEMIFYGVLDFLAKPCFLLYHLWSLSNVEYTQFQLQSGHFSVGAHHAPANLEKGRNGR